MSNWGKLVKKKFKLGTNNSYTVRMIEDQPRSTKINKDKSRYQLWSWSTMVDVGWYWYLRCTMVLMFLFCCAVVLLYCFAVVLLYSCTLLPLYYVTLIFFSSDILYICTFVLFYSCISLRPLLPPLPIRRRHAKR